jgi:hypothetical protein
MSCAGVHQPQAQAVVAGVAQEYTSPRRKQSVLNRIVRGRGRRPWYFQVQLTRCALGQVPYANGDVMLDTRASDARAAAYTADGLLSLAVLGRLYLVVRWLRAALFARFDSPRLAARLADRPHRAVLAARVAILQAPLLTAAASAASAALVLAYVYRVAEGRSRTRLARPAHPSHPSASRTSESSESVPHIRVIRKRPARAQQGGPRTRATGRAPHARGALGILSIMIRVVPGALGTTELGRQKALETTRTEPNTARTVTEAAASRLTTARDRGCRQQAHDGP